MNGTCTIANGGSGGSCDQSGTPLPLAADFSGNIYADIDIPIGSAVNFVADINVSMSDGYFTDAAQEPAGKQGSWTKIDARLGIEAQNGRWGVAVVGRNLGDEKVLGATQSFFDFLTRPTILGYLEPPRTIALQGRLSFGGE